jgi:ABC transport system ATP-binding/permease protein
VLKLIIEDDEGRKTVVPFVRDEITIGRQEGNTIRLTERNVSRRHARLLRQQTNVLIEDLGSYNGIKVNGDRITGQVQVQDGDLIQIGDYDLAVQREEDARAGATVPLDTTPTRSSGPAPTQKLPDPGATMPALPVVSVPEVRDEDIQEAPSDEVPRHQSTAVIRIDQVQSSRPQRANVAIDVNEAPRLVVLNTDFAGREFACTKTELRIGRTDDNDIAIDHRSLSRTHCKVVREDSGEWKVIDMQSANGLMVNGEPYAQVTLRLGDVLELGHVKLKFVGAGDSVTINGTSSSNVTSESEAGQGSSRGPVIAVVVALLVVVAGGGGYAFYRSTSTGTGGGTAEPVKPNPPAVKPVANPVDVEPVKTPPEPGPEVKPPPPVVDPAAGNDQLIADATAAIARGDFAAAELSLRQCKVGESPCPAGRPIVTALSNEKRFAKAMDEAAAALDANDLQKAQDALLTAANTQYQKERHAELEARREKLVKQRLEEQRKKEQLVKATPPPPPPPQPSSDDKVKTLLESARAELKAGQFTTAITLLTDCLKLDKQNADCTVLLGSSFAKRGSQDNNAKDNEKAKEYYKRFLQVASPDDKRREKIEGFLKNP